MHKSIILASHIFGSYYLFYKSLELINKSYLENEKIPTKLIILNGSVLLLSGYLISNHLTNSNIQFDYSEQTHFCI